MHKLVVGLVLASLGCGFENRAEVAEKRQASEWGAPCPGNSESANTPRCEPFQYWTSKGWRWGYLYVACVAGKEVSFASQDICPAFWDGEDCTRCEGNSLVICAGRDLYIAECAGFNEDGDDWPGPGEPGRICVDSRTSSGGGMIDCVRDPSPGDDDDDDDDDDDGDGVPVPSNIVEKGNWPFTDALVEAELEANTGHMYTISSAQLETIAIAALSEDFIPRMLVDWGEGYVETIVGRERDPGVFRAFLEYALTEDGAIDVVIYAAEDETGLYRMGGSRTAW